MVWLKRSVGTDPDSRSGISSSLRNTGFAAQQVDFREFNELFYKSQIDYSWGTQGQVTANEAEFYTDALGVPKDKNGATVTIGNDSRICMVHNVAATADILFNPASGKRFLIQSEVGADIDMGNVGGGIPYKLILGPNVDGCDMMINTSQRFEDIPFASTDAEKRFVANQGVRNKIQVNETVIYDPSKCGNIITKDSFPLNNPYLIRMDGRQENWKLHLTPATNNTIAWFRDLNIYLQGLRDGNEVASRFTLPAIISGSPHLFQVGTLNGMLRDISTADPDIHSRTDANGVSIAATVDFDGSSTVTFQTSVGNAKNFMRIQGGAIPGGSSATTILTDIDEGALTATMVDALTLAPVSVGSASGVAATIDNSGAAGGSLQGDATQTIRGNIFFKTLQDSTLLWASVSGGFTDSTSTSTNTIGANVNTGATVARRNVRFSNEDSTSPNAAKTNDDETRVKSTDVYIFYQG